MPLSEELKRKAVRMDEKEIICPYCFKKFHDNEVVFRSNYCYRDASSAGTDFDEASLFDTGRKSTTAASDDDIRKLFAPYDGAYDPNARKRDMKLEEFWEFRGKSAGFQTLDNKWNYPHIDPADKNFERMVKMEGDTTDARGMVRDRDGFVVRVNEKFGNNHEIMTKLCPKCHNPLPFSNYGKYPVKFISIVGIRGSGKTVYLNQLITKFQTSIARIGYAMGASTLAQATGAEKVAKGYPLPASTDDQVMRRPVAVEMRKTVREQDDNTLTMVFYDIAGENCVDPNEGIGDKNPNTVSQFLAFSDGLFFLIDPEQVPIFANQDASDVPDVQRVIDVVSRIRPAFNHEKDRWDAVPVAVVLTKSDMLNDRSGEIDPIIFRPVDYFNADGSNIKGFARDEFLKINNCLKKEFRERAGDISNSLNAFYRKGFFAVSAITCGVEQKFEKYGNKYTLDEDNYRKFVTLKEWLDGWNKRDVEARTHYKKCPACDAYNNHITIEPEMNLEGEILETRTEIKATVVFDNGGYDEIALTLKDIMDGVELEGYPVAEPDPRRVEEPFLWMMWQMEKIPPYFQTVEAKPEEPVRGFFETSRRFEERKARYNLDYEKYLARQNQYKMEFYCRELPEGDM